MTNKNKSLASESDGDVFVGTIPSWVTLGGGSGESSFGSKTKLFEKVFSQEFRNLKLFLKNPTFQFFLIHRSRGKCTAIILPPILFLKMAGCLRTHRFLSLFLVFDARRIPPRRAGACNTLKEPAGGLWGILNKKHLTILPEYFVGLVKLGATNARVGELKGTILNLGFFFFHLPCSY